MVKGGVASPDGQNKRVTVWNRETKRKISGNAAPMEKNLHEYLRRHPGTAFSLSALRSCGRELHLVSQLSIRASPLFTCGMRVCVVFGGRM